MGLSLCLVGLGVFGYYNPSHLMLVDRLLDHVFVFGVAAVLIAAWGLTRALRRQWLSSVVWLVALVVAMMWVVVGAFTSALSSPGPIVAVAAPHADYQVTVRATSDGVIDPAWAFSIRQTNGVLAKEWEIGCISGDNPNYSFEGVHWVDANTLIVSLFQEEVIVKVESNSGEPEPAVARPWGC